ncbi:MAG: carbon starvation protein A, partial [Treponema sp.]|nr:carbon starvation protein A [Treponema sp.]
LLAGIALMAVAAWLGEVGKNNKMFFIPTIFMLAATLTFLVKKIIEKVGVVGSGKSVWGDWFQLAFAAAMAILAVILVVEGVKTFKKQAAKK